MSQWNRRCTTKQHILDEIKRTAKANGGVPLGKRGFFSETGIKESHWSGIYWSRWGDALEEAGFAPNKLRAAYPEGTLIEKYIALVRELGHPPVKGELKLKRRRDPSFPNDKVFERFGSKRELLTKVSEFCRSHEGFEDIERICATTYSPDEVSESAARGKQEVSDGFVYMLRSGRHYKIGRTNSTGRRQYELDIQLPTKATKVHVIKTDDPVGIEAYWHNRFADKRGNGEWFKLTGADVSAFRRRKFM